ncbi:MAG TPA: O-sialoglycoprotein endopeptidase [Oscillospiraceae bacterium]|nr:O-sialoglycoprotein endopeptidase [Oscillospiraceae bacterium]
MFLGLDTSCYTTSLAVIDTQGRLLSEARQLLKVPQGERGLRQANGVWQHLQNLPQLAQQLQTEIGPLRLQAVAASSQPRPVAGSYMPVFMAGLSLARSLAALAGVPCIELSHQEGHLWAGLWSAKVRWDDFYALHVSGGTTELLSVKQAERLQIVELGGSADLQAGQFIDRVGVAMGFSFPAGPQLEALAQTAGGEIAQVPVSVQGFNMSFSGPESHVQRLLAGGSVNQAAVARGVELCIAESLRRVIINARQQQGEKPVLLVGGVMANKFIRTFLAEQLDGHCAFAQPRFAGDNAVGAALYAQQAGKKIKLANRKR